MYRNQASYDRVEAQLDRIQRIGIVLGLLGFLLCIVGIFIAGPEVFFRSYLFAYMAFLGIVLGSFGVALLHYLTGGNWGYAIRRILEAAAKTIWLFAALFIPILFGLEYLYPWAGPETGAAELLEPKAAYLNIPFFIARAIVYFTVWIALSLWLTRWSLKPEFNIPTEERRKFQRMAAIGLILYVITMTFASTDWIMSLQPIWFSTIYGLVIVTEQALAGFAFAFVVLPLLSDQQPLVNWLVPRHIRDLGAFFLTTVTVWAYIAFSQYLIIWWGNLPRETIWYIYRFSDGWLWIGLLVILVQFILPFIVLLSSQTKRNLTILSRLGSVILAATILYYFWEIKPAFYPGALTIHWLDLLALLAVGGIWLAAFAWYLKRTPVAWLPENKPEDAHEARGKKAAV